jgi:LysM repeat protein
MRPILASAIRIVAAVATTSCAQGIAGPWGNASDRSERVTFDEHRGPRFVYVVQRGDMLSSIAPRLGTSVEALARANGIADLDRIDVGQRLLVPPDAKWTVARSRRPRPVSSSAPSVASALPAPSGVSEAAEIASDERPLLAVDGVIHDTEQRFRSARFEETLEEARKARSLLIPLQSEPGGAERRARIEVLSAMAEVALGRDAAARASFQRALVADPDLTLAPGEVSPKILRRFEETRDQIVGRQASR